jgi:sarcosine oxidase / L-pipecolate oxidase
MLLWKDHPVVDLHHHGYFFPPDSSGLMKMGTGMMGFGYDASQTNPSNGLITAGVGRPRLQSSLTSTHHPDSDHIPTMAKQAIRWILRSMAPSLAEKPFFDTKICWDGMTPDASWIIDRHPKISGPYVAAGGIGHGFKFLPVIGS